MGALATVAPAVASSSRTMAAKPLVRAHAARTMATKPLARATAQTPPAFACSNLLIGGALRGAERGATFDVVDPSSGAAFARVPDASESDLDDAVAAASSRSLSDLSLIHI